MASPWVRYVDEGGHAYVYNTVTGESRWEEVSEKAGAETSEPAKPRRARPAAAVVPWQEDEEPTMKKDYTHMAQVYKTQRKYRDLDSEPPCVLCRKERCLDVLFPCEHKCICRSCQVANGIGEASQGSEWPLCPLCCGEIKRIFPHDGHERDKYWEWVYAIKPRLPDGFKDRFEFAGAYLRHTDDPPDDGRSCLCTIS